MHYTLIATMTPRSLTPEQGQKILEEMRNAVPMNASATGWSTLNTPGNIQRIDWPQWLRDWLGSAKFEFDTVNWMFSVRAKTRAEADAVLAWFEQLRTWAQQNDPEKAAILARVDVKIYDSGEIAEETF